MLFVKFGMENWDDADKVLTAGPFQRVTFQENEMVGYTENGTESLGVFGLGGGISREGYLYLDFEVFFKE
jgi:hypothetical protein